jgi:hypothetical protein
VRPQGGFEVVIELPLQSRADEIEFERKQTEQLNMVKS